LGHHHLAKLVTRDFLDWALIKLVNILANNVGRCLESEDGVYGRLTRTLKRI
jgi:hypothetical protein